MTNKIKIKHDNGVIIGLGLSLLLIWSGFYFSYPNFLELQKEAEQKTEKKVAEQKEINKALAFGQLKLEAQAFAVYDLEKNELIVGNQENKTLSLASITKIMTVLVASENFIAQTPITINQTNGEKGLRQGEKWSLVSLAALTLIGSSNDGATALSEASSTSPINFIDQMNTKAQELGLADLQFTNPTGLDDKATPGGQGSALSVAKLFSYAIKNRPELFLATRESMAQEKSLDGFNHTVFNTNEITNDIPGLLASKTGYTTRAGGNLAVIANLGLRRPIAIVVLGSSESGRFTDTKKIVEATLNYYSNLN